MKESRGSGRGTAHLEPSRRAEPEDMAPWRSSLMRNVEDIHARHPGSGSSEAGRTERGSVPGEGGSP